MKFRVLVYVFFFVPCISYAQHSLDSLLFQLDEAIENHEVYVNQKEERIRHLKKRLNTVTKNTVEEYNLTAAIYDEYRPYICDSAIYYKNKNVQIARQLKDVERLYESKLEMASLMASTGIYMEAVEFLGLINRAKIPAHLLTNYYHTYERVYSELAYYTQDTQGAQRYRQIANQYQDSLRQILTPDNELYYTLEETALRYSNNVNEALAINLRLLEKHELGTREYAITAYNRALDYRQAGNTEGVKYYLALSALSDILSATKDHASLWMLAEILYNENDMERAYNYIRYSWSETVFYNARLRSLQSAVILSLIDKTYQATIEKQNDKLQKYLYLISILAVLLIIAFFYIYRQMKRIAIVRRYLQKANANLKQLNKELNQVNEQLKSVNIDLSESNNIKEEYIGHFIKLCSTYIDKMDAFRRMVHKKISTGKTAELLRTTASHEMMDKEAEELYVNFDKAFLQIFPDFVEKVNDLLIDEERIILKKDELLNTELRILALIRLGINNSSQIADFLRYSVNTIYNYRAKIKNRAKSRDDFEELIALIR
ncbi:MULTISPECIES: DUF6377 domain-containing protein [unclassified Parabacteroides]|uniref:DUF6377 domain-containing protein n=1 Tax=unclassified Parabacteroides TaxID=2649774 RepID=UPI002475B014|nr:MULTISPECIES: DUF6377 domain-containing protein [unclassified Parabacteroides]